MIKNPFRYFPRYLMVKIIKIYQKTLSFDHGPLKFMYPHGFCRFQPTCSEYGIKAITKYGIFKGSYLTVKRVLKCNPFNKGGYDPLK
jgi:uncharacterized protein